MWTEEQLRQQKEDSEDIQELLRVEIAHSLKRDTQ